MRSIRSANLARRGPGIGRYRGRVLTGPQIWRLAGPGSVDIADALRPVRRKRPACRQAVRLAEVPGKVVCGVFGRAKSRTASNFRCAKLPGTKVPWSLPLQHPYWARLTHV